MPSNRLPREMKQSSPTCRRNYGRPLKRLPDTWEWNGSTSGPPPRQIYYEDDEIINSKISTSGTHFYVSVLPTFTINCLLFNIRIQKKVGNNLLLNCDAQSIHFFFPSGFDIWYRYIC